MSATTIVTIMCDAEGCGQWWDPGVADTAKIARAQLRGTGWRLAVPIPGSRLRQDFCPKHAHLEPSDEEGSHCALCGVPVRYGSRCPAHYGVYPEPGNSGSATS